MMMPSIFRENLFDDLWDGFTKPLGTLNTLNNLKPATAIMRTDIKELDGSYELDIDLPGVSKEDVTAELSDGYLTVTAKHGTEKEDKDDNGKYICKERYCGSASRTFYVGNQVKQGDITAKFDNGILKLSVPKPDKDQVEDTHNYITIE